MTRLPFAILGSLASVLAFTAPVAAQGAGHSDVSNESENAPPHTIVINLIERPGAMPFAFEPGTITAHHGDTLRFVQLAATMHNVHIKTAPKGARLGSASVSQYLTTKGQAYSLVVDARFVDGTYEVVCDPHEMVGMHAFISVSGKAGIANGK
jgi:plastocyanin